jgi:hypothetical protein
MLTRQQIIDTFINGINETPDDILIKAYQDLGFTQQQLDAVIARNIAARTDTTYSQRVAEDYQSYMAATDEERSSWKHVEPQ